MSDTIHRDNLIAELHELINANAGQPFTDELPEPITNVLAQIQRETHRINSGRIATIGAILEQQDAIAQQVFREHAGPSPELSRQLADTSRMIDEFACSLHYQAAA